MDQDAKLKHAWTSHTKDQYLGSDHQQKTLCKRGKETKMKTKKMLLSAAIALSTALTPVAAMAIQSPVFAANVQITQEGHAYTAYKIFSGEEETVNGKTQLTKIDWAEGVNGNGILEAIKNSTDENLASLKSATSAPTLADALQKAAANGSDLTSRAFAKLLNENLSLLGNADYENITNESNTNMAVGYYLLKDNTTPAPTQEVVGLSILKVAKSEGTIVIEPKNEKPGVDKQVWDNDVHDVKAPAVDPEKAGQVENPGFGESADHFIGEQFEFQLNTTGLTYKTVRAYDEYYLEFSDSWTEGITVEATGNTEEGSTASNITVTVNGETKTNEFTIAVNQTERKLNVSIDNLKTVLPENMSDSDSIKVVVTYKAHLNENAVMSETTMDNKNDVELIYSNNPNTKDHGTSEKDNVFVGTFKLTNTKTDADGKILSGAGFKLKNSAGKYAKFTTTEDGRHVFNGWDDEGDGIEITSDANGLFNMEGLDAGTYTLVETTVPDGYKKAADTKIEIQASHSEVSEGTDAGNKATVTIEGTNSSGATVVNSKISNLPETGGMGTTMIYSAGALLVAGAAVAFVTNKRMRKED